MRALVFFPHNPYPIRSGAHQRCLTILEALQAIGYRITLLSSTLFTDSPWTEDSIRYLYEKKNIEVEVYEGTLSDQHYINYLGAAVGCYANFSMYSPPGLKQKFREMFRRLSPDLVVINYALWGGLAVGDEFHSACRVIDTIDLFSRNLKMRNALNSYHIKYPIDVSAVPEGFLAEDFFFHFDIEASDDEYWICDQYDFTIAISPAEAQIIKNHTQHTKVEYVPMALDPSFIENIYSGNPVFAVGPNPFNLQGYCYFAKKVLPQILRIHPEFTLNVVGKSCDQLMPSPGTELLGFIPDLQPIYSKASFAICPLIGGTGQQTKIVEAMAYGLPVISLRNTAESSPIEHGKNGFIAEDSEAFAKYAIQLYEDRDLCRVMGSLARETIAENFSGQKLAGRLRRFLDSPRNQLSEKISANISVTPKVIIDGIFFQIKETGIARLWSSLLEEWARGDFAKHIVVLDRSSTAPKIPGIRYRQIQAYSYAETAIDSVALQNICDEERADIFISSYYTTPISTPSIFMGYDMIPEVMGVNMETQDWKEKKYAILHALHSITISENTAQDLIRFYPHISREAVTIAYCGVGDEFFPASSDEIAQFKQEFAIKKPYLMVVGERIGVSGYKNAQLLFKALSQSSTAQDVELVCIGGSPDLEPELVALSKDISVHLLRLTDASLRAAYSGALALVYPSLYEGFGLPVAEAMACGCPVITARNSSIPEVAGDAAIYIDPSSTEDLLNAIDFIKQPEARQLLIEKGFENAQKFTWSKMAAVIESTLRQVSEKAKSPSVQAVPPIWAEFRDLQGQVKNLQKAQIFAPDTKVDTNGQTRDLAQELLTTQEELRKSRERIQRVKQRLRSAESAIEAMKSSKFWKLRSFWIRLKQRIGLSTGENEIV